MSYPPYGPQAGYPLAGGAQPPVLAGYPQVAGPGLLGSSGYPQAGGVQPLGQPGYPQAGGVQPQGQPGYPQAGGAQLPGQPGYFQTGGVQFPGQPGYPQTGEVQFPGQPGYPQASGTQPPGQPGYPHAGGAPVQGQPSYTHAGGAPSPGQAGYPQPSGQAGYPHAAGAGPLGPSGYPQAGGAQPQGQAAYPHGGGAYGVQSGFRQMNMPTPQFAAYDSATGGQAYPAQSGAEFGVPQAFGATPQGYGTTQEYGITPQGYVTKSQGYGTTPQGYGTTPQGYGTTPLEYGTTPQGYGTTPQGYGTTSKVPITAATPSTQTAGYTSAGQAPSMFEAPPQGHTVTPHEIIPSAPPAPSDTELTPPVSGSQENPTAILCNNPAPVSSLSTSDGGQPVIAQEKTEVAVADLLDLGDFHVTESTTTKPTDMSEGVATKPTDVSEWDATKLTDVSEGDTNKSTDVSEGDMDKPTNVSEWDATKSTVASEGDTNKPEEVTKEEVNKPEKVTSADDDESPPEAILHLNGKSVKEMVLENPHRTNPTAAPYITAPVSSLPAPGSPSPPPVSPLPTPISPLPTSDEGQALKAQGKPEVAVADLLDMGDLPVTESTTTKPTDVSEWDASKPKDSSEGETTKPTDVSEWDATKPTDVSEWDATKPTNMSESDTNKSADVSEGDTNKLTKVTKERANISEDVTSADEDEPPPEALYEATLLLNGKTVKEIVTETPHRPNLTEASHNKSVSVSSLHTPVDSLPTPVSPLPTSDEEQPLKAQGNPEVAVADLLDLGDGKTTKPTEVSEWDATKPTDVSEGDTNNPTDVSEWDATKPADVRNWDATKPTDMGERDTNKPTDVSDEDANKSEKVTKEDVNIPEEETSADDDEPPPEALYEAILLMNRKTVKEIVLENPHRANNPREGVTPLMFAANYGKLPIIKLLLDLGVDINGVGGNDVTALRSAIMSENEDCVELLIERGADIDDCGPHGRPIIHLLVAHNMYKPLRHSIMKGCDVNIQDTDGNTPLHDAIYQKKQECTEVLLGCSRTDLRITNDKDFNIFHKACLEDNTFAVEKILARDPAIVDVTTPKLGYTALHVAARSGHVKSGKIILEKSKASLDQRARNGKTPLHLATEDCSSPFIQLLIENGADVNMTDWRGDTPFHTMFGPNSNFFVRLKNSSMFFKSDVDEYTEASILLLKAQAGYNRRNAEGITALQLCRVEELKLALEKYIKDNEGSLNADPGPDKPKANLVVAAAPHLTPCCVCIENVAIVIFKPCEHKVLCSACSKDCTHCPECGAAIEDMEDDQFKIQDMCPVQ